MITGHPSEMELQYYAMDESGCTTEMIGHIQQCSQCLESVSAYRHIIGEIEQEPRPAFDFNIADLILPQLRQSSRPVGRKDVFFYILIFGAFGSLALPFYWLRNYLAKMFAGLMPMVIYLMATTTLLILLFFGLEMARKYKKQLKALNYQ